MPKAVPARKVTLAQTNAYLNKAQEYLDAATASLEAQRLIAATSLAIHSAIDAADAVTGVRLGIRAAAQGHDQVLQLLAQAGPDGAAVPKDLGRLLPLKTKAEYDPDTIPKRAAEKAVESARRCVTIARRILTSLQQQ